MSPKKKAAKDKTKTKAKAKTKEKKDRLLAALSYIFILGLIAYISEKKDAFTRFHMRQGLALFIIWLVVTLGLSLLSFILFPIAIFFAILIRLALLIYLVIMVIWFYYAWKGEKKEIGFVQDILKKVGV